MLLFSFIILFYKEYSFTLFLDKKLLNLIFVSKLTLKNYNTKLLN